MSNLTKNLVTILGLVTVVFAGFYFYAQKDALDTGVDDLAVQEMLVSTEVFIVRSQELDEMDFDLSVFENERFKTLRSFTSPIQEQSVGRTDPFAPVNGYTNSIQSD